MHDIEAGIEGKHLRYTWGANIYYMKYVDQLIPTGKINDVGAYTRINIPNSYRAGVELQATAEVFKWLNVGGNITVSSNKVKNFEEYYDDYDNGGQKTVFHQSADIAFSPAVTGAAAFDFRPVKNTTITWMSKYVGRQYLDNTSTKSRSLDPYFVQDARITFVLANKLVRETALVLQVNNVLNKKYEANGYTFSYQYEGSVETENYYFPMAGINVMFGVNFGL
jgi:iron complex outermembrane receptor protein